MSGCIVVFLKTDRGRRNTTGGSNKVHVALHSLSHKDDEIAHLLISKPIRLLSGGCGIVPR